MRPRVGVTLPQFGDEPERLEAAVAAIEASDLDSMWVFDHMWPLSGGKRRPIFEAWTTLAWLAARAGTKTVGTLVTRSSLRHPAVLAKMAATVGEMAPGRLIVAIGSGDDMSREENEAFGIDYYSGEDRVDQLRSTVEVVVRFLTQEEVTQHDDFVDLAALPVSPRTALPVPVWVGGRSGDALEIAGTLADGWNGWGSDVERFTQDANVVLAYTEGRPFEVTWGGLVVLAETDAQAERKAAGKGDDIIAGSPETVTEKLARFVDAGASHLVLTPLGRWEPEVVAALNDEVLPGLPGISP
ncbi:MAG: LLM class flavin-dependent oxidoreductase [Actinomycetota bacterium]